LGNRGIGGEQLVERARDLRSGERLRDEQYVIGFARAQAGLDLGVIACALERHRLASGRYPDTLETLAPKFLSTILPDVITGQPLKYRLTENGRFLLYSVGWNQSDDGGAAGLTARRQMFDPNKGDWVWCYQTPVPSQ